MRKSTKQLIIDAGMAIAWGGRDNESTGYSPSEFISLISELKQRLIELEQYELKKEQVYELGIPEPKNRIRHF